jgi:hypothetical protein
VHLAVLTEVEVSRSLKGIGNEKKPTFVTCFKVCPQQTGLFRNRLLDTGKCISRDLAVCKVGTPTALFRPIRGIDLYQIDFRWLARSVFEVDPISIGRDVSRHELHDGIGDPTAICPVGRFTNIEE